MITPCCLLFLSSCITRKSGSDKLGFAQIAERCVPAVVNLSTSLSKLFSVL